MTYGETSARWLAHVIWNNLPRGPINSVSVGRGYGPGEREKAILKKFEIRLAEVIDEILKDKGRLELYMDNKKADEITTMVAKETGLINIFDLRMVPRRRVILRIKYGSIIGSVGSLIEKIH